VCLPQVAQAQADAKELLKKMPLPKGETPKKEKPSEVKEAAVANTKENDIGDVGGIATEGEPASALTRTNSGKMVDQKMFMAMVKKNAAMLSGASLEVPVAQHGFCFALHEPHPNAATLTLFCRG